MAALTLVTAEREAIEFADGGEEGDVTSALVARESTNGFQAAAPGPVEQVAEITTYVEK